MDRGDGLVERSELGDREADLEGHNWDRKPSMQGTRQEEREPQLERAEQGRKGKQGTLYWVGEGQLDRETYMQEGRLVE